MGIPQKYHKIQQFHLWVFIQRKLNHYFEKNIYTPVYDSIIPVYDSIIYESRYGCNLCAHQ